MSTTDDNSTTAPATTPAEVATGASAPLTTGAGTPPPWWHLGAQAGMIALVRTALGWAVAAAALRVLQPLPNGIAPTFTSAFLRWDANWISYIVAGGYGHDERLTTFFPAFPLLAQAVHHATGLSNPWSTLLLSPVLCFLGVWGTMALSATLWPARPANRAGMLLAFSPASVFLLAGYSESAFVALAAWTLNLAARRRLVLATAVAAVASAARPEGVLVGLAVVAAHGLRRQYLRAIAAGAAATTGLLAYLAFCWARFGSPFTFVHVQDYWHRTSTWPFAPFLRSVHDLLVHRDQLGANAVVTYAVDDVAVVVALGSLVWLCLRARHDRRILPLLAVAVPSFLLTTSSAVGGTSPEAAVRILMTIVPLHLFASAIRRDVTWSLVLATSATLAIGCQLLYNLQFWFT